MDVISSASISCEVTLDHKYHNCHIPAKRVSDQHSNRFPCWWWYIFLWRHFPRWLVRRYNCGKNVKLRNHSIYLCYRHGTVSCALNSALIDQRSCMRTARPPYNTAISKNIRNTIQFWNLQDMALSMTDHWPFKGECGAADLEVPLTHSLDY